MTVIAWDGKTLAVDSQVSDSTGYKQAADKIWRFEYGDEKPDALLAVFGVLAHGAPLVEWFKSGATPSDYPFPASTVNEFVGTSLVVVSGNQVMEYGASPYPDIQPISVKQAWGSGGQMALGAMLAGYTAVQAAQLSCKHITTCGGPVKSMTMEGAKADQLSPLANLETPPGQEQFYS